MSSERVTVTDVRQAGMCVAGCRRWFQAHGFSDQEFREFLKNGLPADELLRRGDGLVKKVLERKEERRRGQQ